MADKVYYDLVNTGGRSKKILNEVGIQTVENLAHIMCTEDEICSIIGMSNDTVHNADNDALFRTACEKGRKEGKSSLRRKQYEIAMKGNCTMLVWLGKQYLEQSEKLQADVKDMNENKELLKQYLEAHGGKEKAKNDNK